MIDSRNPSNRNAEGLQQNYSKSRFLRIERLSRKLKERRIPPMHKEDRREYIISYRSVSLTSRCYKTYYKREVDFIPRG